MPKKPPNYRKVIAGINTLILYISERTDPQNNEVVALLQDARKEAVKKLQGTDGNPG